MIEQAVLASIAYFGLDVPRLRGSMDVSVFHDKIPDLTPQTNRTVLHIPQIFNYKAIDGIIVKKENPVSERKKPGSDGEKPDSEGEKPGSEGENQALKEKNQALKGKNRDCSSILFRSQWRKITRILIKSSSISDIFKLDNALPIRSGTFQSVKSVSILE